MRLTRGNNAQLPSTLNLSSNDDGILIKALSDAGLPVSCAWVLTYDKGFEYSERIGSLSAVPHTFTATGVSVTYTPPNNALQSWQGPQHAVIIATPSDGSATRSLQITIG